MFARGGQIGPPSGRVAGSVEDLPDAVKVRIKRERLARTRAKKCAERGKRVYDLAKKPDRPEGGLPQVLDDDQVKALLQDLESLANHARPCAFEWSSWAASREQARLARVADCLVDAVVPWRQR